ncbi:hypothetical protein RCL1_006238 [Eukaryota sp. TZLM3-RCL]
MFHPEEQSTKVQLPYLGYKVHRRDFGLTPLERPPTFLPIESVQNLLSVTNQSFYSAPPQVDPSLFAALFPQPKPEEIKPSGAPLKLKLRRKK